MKEAQADEHKADTSLKFYTERPWPQCDVLVGNPPFLGGKCRLRITLPSRETRRTLAGHTRERRVGAGGYPPDPPKNRT